MERGCYGRFIKAKSKKTGRKQLRIEELGETWQKAKTQERL
jgi:hypothetical protein